VPESIEDVSELTAPHIGHDNICHQQVDAEATGQDIESQAPIARFDDAEALLSESSSDHLTLDVVILDDKDGSWLRRVWHGGAPGRCVLGRVGQHVNWPLPGAQRTESVATRSSDLLDSPPEVDYYLDCW